MSLGCFAVSWQVCTLLSFGFYWRGNLNLSVFALTGLPGGIDYALLVCVGQGWLPVERSQNTPEH